MLTYSHALSRVTQLDEISHVPKLCPIHITTQAIYAMLSAQLNVMIRLQPQVELLERTDMVPPKCAVPLPKQLRLDSAAGRPAGKAALATVLERSRQLCLQRYEKVLCMEDSCLRYYEKLGVPLDPAQLAIFASAPFSTCAMELSET